jgi:prepilin-type N-terminal cleavage/methylation domain-containing protein
MVRNVKGFTLVELMIVIAIIGVLAVALIPTLVGSQGKARDTSRISGLTQASTSLTSYATDYGQYPSSSVWCLTATDGDIKTASTVYYGTGVAGTSTANVNTNVAAFFANGKGPVDPQKSTLAGTSQCAIKWSYGYQAGKSTVAFDSAVLVANVEAAARGNVLVANIPAMSNVQNGTVSATTSLTQGSGTGYIRVVSGN